MSLIKEPPKSWLTVRTAYVRFKFKEDGSISGVHSMLIPTREDLLEYQTWCRDNVGRYNKLWEFNEQCSQFYFQEEQDAMAFKLRFGFR